MKKIKQQLKNFLGLNFVSKFSKEKSPNPKGFTLVEVLVAVTIIGLITSIVVFNHSSFSERIELTDAAYEAALLVREAQSAGSSAKAEGDAFEYAYGVYSRYKDAGPPWLLYSDNKLVLFADINDDGFYGDDSAQEAGDFDCNHEECEQVLELPQGIIIKEICRVTVSSGTECAQAITGLSTTFLRPKLDSRTLFFNPGGSDPYQDEPEETLGASICLQAESGREQAIEILKTGQVSVVECP